MADDERLVVMLTDLSTDALGLVLMRLAGRARDIARVASVNRAFRNAARIAEQAHRCVCYETGQPVMCVAAVPDGRIITGSDSMTNHLQVWLNGVCECTIQAHTNGVYAVAVLPGDLSGPVVVHHDSIAGGKRGARFISGSCDGTAKLWTLDGALERTFSAGDEVACIAALPDGVHFVLGTYKNEVRLYHVGTLVHTFGAHSGDLVSASLVSALAVTRDGQYIISGGDGCDAPVKVWSVATKSLVSTCIGHRSEINAVAAMPDGQRILSGGDTVRVWLLDGTPENTFKLHTGRVTALVTAPDNQHALSAGSGDVKLFNVNDGAVVRTFMHTANAIDIHCLALLPDGLRFVCGHDRLPPLWSDPTAQIVELGLNMFKPTLSAAELSALKEEVERVEKQIRRAQEHARSLRTRIATAHVSDSVPRSGRPSDCSFA